MPDRSQTQLGCRCQEQGMRALSVISDGNHRGVGGTRHLRTASTSVASVLRPLLIEGAYFISEPDMTLAITLAFRDP